MTYTVVNVANLAAIASFGFNSSGTFGVGITTLQAGDFAGLTSLWILDLTDNSLTSLPGGVFSDLNSLTTLNFTGNDLDSLPETAFSGLNSLTSLRMYNNKLATLPDGLFSGLTALEVLTLGNNKLTTLPDGLFSGLTSLTQLSVGGNSTNPMELTVTVAKEGTNQATGKVLAGAPFAVDIPVTLMNGTLAGDATALSVPVGAVDGTALTVTRTSGTTTAVTVDVDLTSQPTLPEGHSGCGFAAATNLPATILPDQTSSDATLSALTVTAGGSDLVTFASDDTDYTAIGGEYRRRGDGNGGDDRFRRVDRISGRVRHDARRRGHLG